MGECVLEQTVCYQATSTVLDYFLYDEITYYLVKIIYSSLISRRRSPETAVLHHRKWNRNDE